MRDGATGIMALGTMGECATTSQSDYEAYVDCLLKTVRGRIPTFVGTTALGGHEIARRIKFVKELGATGTLLGIPMWQPATVDMAVKFYADVAQTFPDFPIMVYANPRAFRFDFDADFWGPVVDRAPTVMSAKFSTKAILKQVVSVTKGRVNFVPPIGLAYEFAQISPESQTTCWIPSVGPQVAVALMKALAARDAQQAKASRRRHRLGQRTPSCDHRLARNFRFLQYSAGKSLDGGFRLLQDRSDPSALQRHAGGFP